MRDCACFCSCICERVWRRGLECIPIIKAAVHIEEIGHVRKSYPIYQKGQLNILLFIEFFPLWVPIKTKFCLLVPTFLWKAPNICLFFFSFTLLNSTRRKKRTKVQKILGDSIKVVNEYTTSFLTPSCFYFFCRRRSEISDFFFIFISLLFFFFFVFFFYAWGLTEVILPKQMIKVALASNPVRNSCTIISLPIKCFWSRQSTQILGRMRDKVNAENACTMNLVR